MLSKYTKLIKNESDGFKERMTKLKKKRERVYFMLTITQNSI